MLMADTMAIFFVVLGLMLALPGLWLLCRGLWPRTVADAETTCGKGLIKPFLIGLPITGLTIVVAAVMSNLGPAGKIGAVAIVCFYLVFASCGVAGLIAVIGQRLASPIDASQPWRATLRGGIVLELSFLLPVLGWFGLLPISFTIGCGAACIALFRRMLARATAKARLPQSTVSANGEAASYAGTIGAER